MIAIIGGETRQFRPLVDIYRESGRQAGHAAEELKVGIHVIGYVAETTQEAIDDFPLVMPRRFRVLVKNAAGGRSRDHTLTPLAAGMAR
jgi:alkanesulfonate monooxygenase SsuD/methylene tetrahydromethanopterin reductase-like flavin-dependent oxidoreductase (luciferase family)